MHACYAEISHCIIADHFTILTQMHKYLCSTARYEFKCNSVHKRFSEDIVYLKDYVIHQAYILYIFHKCAFHLPCPLIQFGLLN